VPRALVGALVGAALAVAGALMQGLTRNPLADPGILGIETGAALGVVGAVFLLKIDSLYLYALFAFAGAALTAGAVYALGALGRGGPTPLKTTLAGAAVTALLSSLTTGMLLLNQRTLEEVRFWLAGSLAGRDMPLLTQVAPYLLAGLALGRRITTARGWASARSGISLPTHAPGCFSTPASAWRMSRVPAPRAWRSSNRPHRRCTPAVRAI
jgi:iron complex transport system permease protein